MRQTELQLNVWQMCEMLNIMFLWLLSLLTLILLMWRIWWAPNNASKWQMGCNLAFKRLPSICTSTGWRKKNACFLICLRFLSLGLPQIKSLRSKTSYGRRSESFHSWRNCNCATRNASKCDAELWGEAADVCTARRTPSFWYNFL